MGDETQAAMQYSPGDAIGDKYRLVCPVGRGAMGAVWQATQPELSLDVAIKILHQRHQDSDVASRLLREAQVAAQLQHPGLVRAFDFGTTDRGDPYIVLEWLDGDNLGEILDSKGALSPEMAARIFLSVASSVAALHEGGVVHRDIKPDNILLVRDSSNSLRTKLVDFGIAKTDDADGAFVPQQTEEGILGTPGYLAPEQVLGEEVDGYTDVWALCVTLVEAMSGEPLIDGDGVMSVMMLKAEGAAPELVTRYPALPADLLRIAQRGLALVGAERLSIQELQRELAGWLEERGVREDVSGVAIAHYLSPTPDVEGCRLVPLHPTNELVEVVVDLGQFKSSSESRGQTLLSSEVEVDADERDSRDVILRPRRRVGGWVAAAAAAVFLGLLTQAPVRASIVGAAGNVASDARGVLSSAAASDMAPAVPAPPSVDDVRPVAPFEPRAISMDTDDVLGSSSDGPAASPTQNAIKPTAARADSRMPVSNLEISVSPTKASAQTASNIDESNEEASSIYDATDPSAPLYHPGDI